MQFKNELKDYCEAVRALLSSQTSDAMQRAFNQWLDVLPDKNVGILSPTDGDIYPQQAYLLTFMPEVEIGFSVSNILKQFDERLLNVSRIQLSSIERIVYSQERLQPFKEDADTIMAVQFPVSLTDIRSFRDYIIDGNKRISEAIRNEQIHSVSYNRIEPHSLAAWCFTDVYSHFIMLYTYDMVLSVVHSDPLGVLFRVGAETIPKLAKNYPKFLDVLARSPSS